MPTEILPIVASVTIVTALSAEFFSVIVPMAIDEELGTFGAFVEFWGRRALWSISFMSVVYAIIHIVLSAALIYGTVYYADKFGFALWPTAFFAAWIYVTAETDRRTFYLADMLVFPGLAFGLVFSYYGYTPALTLYGGFAGAAACGFMFLSTQWLAGKLVKRRTTFMHMGDIKFAMAIGSWIGPLGAFFLMSATIILWVITGIIDKRPQRQGGPLIAFGAAALYVAAMHFVGF